MKPTYLIIFLLLVFIVGCKDTSLDMPEKVSMHSETEIEAKPRLSFTFDDGNTSDLAGFPFEEWNQQLLSHLKNENLKAMFFVTGRNKLDQKGQFLLKSWDEQGHQLANHSFSHPNFNSEKNTSQLFERELKKTDQVISDRRNYVKLFRFPYLKEGQNQAKVDSIRTILANHNYVNGYVTIDASDWYVDQRLIGRIREVGYEKAEINRFRDFYVQHIWERANFYERLSYEINGRHINHTLLLHHNLASALFLDDLIAKFKKEGWELMDADKAYEDEIFQHIPSSSFAGESLIYAMAKQSGKYNGILRYPAEDSKYEKDKMDALKL